MSGKKLLAVMLVTLILSACAGKTQPQIERRLADNSADGMTSYEDAVESLTPTHNHHGIASARQDLVPAVHRDSRKHRSPEDEEHFYDYEEPSPQAQRAAEAALILTGSVFLCTFVVVVLDGACNFGFGFGYHYY